MSTSDRDSARVADSTNRPAPTSASMAAAWAMVSAFRAIDRRPAFARACLERWPRPIAGAPARSEADQNSHECGRARANRSTSGRRCRRSNPCRARTRRTCRRVAGQRRVRRTADGRREHRFSEQQSHNAAGLPKGERTAISRCRERHASNRFDVGASASSTITEPDQPSGNLLSRFRPSS